MITGRTRVFALLGDPVAHSLSPAIHNAAFRALGLDAVYVPIRCQPAELPALIRALAGAGGGGNVTVPHKRAAAAAVAPADGQPAARFCNTFWGGPAGPVGVETDSLGIARGWEDLGRPAGDWLVLGTGGSALAAAIAAARIGAGIAVRSRSAGRAAAFEAEAASLGARRAGGRIGMVINCTPLGLGRDDPPPLPPGEFPEGAAGLDLVYRPGGTGWVRTLAAEGVPARDGRVVLLAQGAAAFERWYPELQAPVEVMGAALARALG